MKKYKYLLFTLLLFLIFTFNVNAQTNLSTDFDVIINEQDYSSLIDSSNSFNDVLNNLVSLGSSSSYYDYIITTSKNNNGFISINLYLFPKGLDYFPFYSYSYNGNPSYFSLVALKFDISKNYYSFTLNKTSSGNIYNSSDYTNLTNCFTNNISCGTSSSTSPNTSMVLSSSYGVDSSSNDSDLLVNFDTLYNNNSYTNKIYYYSSLPMKLMDYTSISSNSTFIKNLIINDISYSFGDYIPSYYDLYISNNNSSSIDYLSKLGTIYMNFSPSDINSFNLDLNFDVYNLTALQYKQNLSYTWGCYAREYHSSSDYYTYIKFPYCDFEENGDYVLDSNSLKLSFENLSIYDSFGQQITNFNVYDKIFFYIDFQYNNDIYDKTLSNLIINSIGINFYQDNFRGPIYENFDNLPLLFKLFVTTYKQDYSYFFVKYSGTTLTDKFFINKQQYNLSDLNVIGNSSFLGTTFQNLSVNRNLNLGYMFFQNISSQNSGVDIPSLDLIIFEDIMISLNNSSSNDFYYYDSNGNISHSDITINYDSNSNNNYDLHYYYDKIFEFQQQIDTKINDFHDVIQDFYSSLPSSFQFTLLVLFILFCSYIIFKEIRR